MSHVTGRDPIRIRIVSAESNHLIRLLGLLWRRLGSAQIYAVVILSLVLLLAGVGVWHLIAPPAQITAPSTDHRPPAAAPLSSTLNPPSSSLPPTPAPSTPVPASSALERQIAITDLTEEERPGPRGEEIVIGTIGLTSRTDVEKNHVEIAVFFFDLTPDNEMRPTKAQITYRWLTPIRDWSDPEPKYLAATYLKRRSSRRMPDELRYGGFIVRVYSDGKLQDERSQPEALLTRLRSTAIQQPLASPPVTPSTPPVAVASPSIPPSSVRPPPPALSPTIHQSPVTNHPSENLPYGKPVPGKPGFVSSPYDPKFLIDVRGFPPGTLVIDPNTNKPFRVP